MIVLCAGLIFKMVIIFLEDEKCWEVLILWFCCHILFVFCSKILLQLQVKM